MQRSCLILRQLATMSSNIKLIDIGVNLTDAMYQGEYHGSKKHEPDLDAVLERAWKHGLDKMMITGGSLDDAHKALEIARSHDQLYTTIGCHPTRCNEFDQFEEGGAEGYLTKLKGLIETNKDKVVAIGECGLDYDRLNFCQADVQKKYFEAQLDLSGLFELPLFLHCRAAATDMLDILKKNQDKLCSSKGVVHSFDGTLEEAQAFIDLGYSIGLNGCSLKTEDNLKVVKNIPLEHLMLETDAPWCDIRNSHASSKLTTTNYFKSYKVANKPNKWVMGGLVKGRNEPIFIHQVLDVISALKELKREEAAQVMYDNTMRMFFPKV